MVPSLEYSRNLQVGVCVGVSTPVKSAVLYALLGAWCGLLYLRAGSGQYIRFIFSGGTGFAVSQKHEVESRNANGKVERERAL